MRRNWKILAAFAALGFAITAFMVAYQILTDSSPPWELNPLVYVAFIFLCPASFLAIPLIYAETGTDGFYFIWFFVALSNSVLYAVVGAQILFLSKKSG
jgi:hypothetical protein